MSDKIYYWNNRDKDSGGTEEPFIEFSAKTSKMISNLKTPPPPDGGGGVESHQLTVPVVRIQEEHERGRWSNKLDFLFSCISLSVGLGNVWRFPYLSYKNGGGAFLVTYGIAMIFCGIPIFFQEVAIGQYLGSGGMNMVGQLCPLLQGVGYATMTLVFFLDIYYCIIMAWTIFYLISSFVSLPGLPWADCGNWWNTENCYSASMDTIVNHVKPNFTTTPVEEFLTNRVLQVTEGIEHIGGMQWELLGCLVLAWGLVYLIVCRGLHQSGKIIWFTALFPYVVLFILCGRAVTLSGAGQGLLFYITPRWDHLLRAGPWIDGATQIFFAYSIGTGALPALGSYNKFHHNCYRDAFITCIINTITSLLAGIVTFAILGHIAHEQDKDVASVVKSGPALVFLVYPDVVLNIPGAPIWAALFFVMLLILGIDSEFCLVESFITGMVDMWPKTLRPHRNKFAAAVCFIMLLLGIPMVTQGGIYIFTLMDFFSASGMSLLWVCFFQTIAISWIFGAKKFTDCVQEMIGIRISVVWYICWVYLAPAVMCAIFIFYFADYQPLTYAKKYTYPPWAEVVGFMISMSSMLWVPGYAIYYVLAYPGTIKENFYNGLKPNIIPRSRTGNTTPAIPMSESTAGLLPKNGSFLKQ